MKSGVISKLGHVCIYSSLQNLCLTMNLSRKECKTNVNKLNYIPTGKPMFEKLNCGYENVCL